MLKWIVLTCFILTFESALANVYTWRDENGTRHYSNISHPESCIDYRRIQELFPNIPPAKQKTIYSELEFRVQKVYDGDSILVKGHGLTFSVRLAGIDAPETGKKDRPGQPFGQAARAQLQKILTKEQIRLKPYGLDRYNRQLAEVFLGNQNINIEMVLLGLAEVYQGKLPDSLNANAYFKAQKKAKMNNKGMWRQKGNYESPRKWRKRHR